jgi:hypothetical protein
MKRNAGQLRRCSGFSLGEMLATIVIGGMVLTAILTIYSRANRAATAVLEKIEGPSLSMEVLQLIAEDFDRFLGADDVTMQIRNGFDNGFPRADLVLRRVYHDKDNKEQVLEEITWRAAYDSEGETPGLILYRSREGAGQEDKLLENQRKDWEKSYTFVPVCRGLTFFQVHACKGEELLDQWPPSAPPAGVKVTISFAEPYKSLQGTQDVSDEQKVSRTFVVDAMRKIKFVTDLSGDPNAPQDANDANQPGMKKQESSGDKTQTTQRSTGGRTTNQGTTSVRSSRGTVSNERTPVQTKSR